MIDELEMALHPSAQVRFVNQLKDYASDKHLTIIISTHSPSIIRIFKSVILLEKDISNDEVIVINTKCPPAKAIGAIAMQEDTSPDIVSILEDDMAKYMLDEMFNVYRRITEKPFFLEVKSLYVGGYSNVVNFYLDSSGYVFHETTYLCAVLDFRLTAKPKKSLQLKCNNRFSCGFPASISNQNWTKNQKVVPQISK
ncbi:hypothetical protein SBF1_6640005 [Candidatus Desulfosporosinus infrequens]|uniref:ATPase AAA-type core domain-containing protein n=1 Tax=Candidatus Desulfosporosinus infrequens TaxID=2043169 RepID=A0A2U3LNC3_9FIRM|nr:hypothetical protein SBF1_6640005 [Candidatus Desulfosporosinus infrequens]